MSTCAFCDSPAEVRELHELRVSVKCPVCHPYKMTKDALEDGVPQEMPKNDKILFSGYLRNLPETERPLITNAMIVRIPEIVTPYKNLTVPDKINNVLRYVGESSKFLNEKVAIDKFNDYTLFFCLNNGELNNILNYLQSRNFIVGEESNTQKKAALTVDGWAEYLKLKQINLNSKKVFVAMNFDPEFNEIYDEAILPACDDCGFIANRVDKSEHNEKICDRIISEIKESRFVIADFTGQKYGVYYEAGYAQGLGLQVIWICRKDEVEDNKLHFDVRQYNCIAWETKEELKKRLYERIKATI